MAFDDQKLPLSRNVGDAFAVVCRVLGGHTPNGVARALRMDRKTARNALDGKAGVPVITRALQDRQKTADDHWEAYLAIGQMIFGETLDQYEERKLQRIIEDTENARRLVDERKARRRELVDRASTHGGDLGRSCA